MFLFRQHVNYSMITCFISFLLCDVMIFNLENGKILIDVYIFSKKLCFLTLLFDVLPPLTEYEHRILIVLDSYSIFMFRKLNV